MKDLSLLFKMTAQKIIIKIRQGVALIWDTANVNTGKPIYNSYPT